MLALHAYDIVFNDELVKEAVAADVEVESVHFLEVVLTGRTN